MLFSVNLQCVHILLCVLEQPRVDSSQRRVRGPLKSRTSWEQLDRPIDLSPALRIILYTFPRKKSYRKFIPLGEYISYYICIYIMTGKYTMLSIRSI